MILESLYKYAQAHSDELPPAGMEWKEIEYVIVIDEKGKFIRFESKRLDKKKCVSFLVAKEIKRTSNLTSNILWDKGKYVLGIGNGTEIYHELFVGIIRDIAAKHPDHTSIQALRQYYDVPQAEIECLMQQDPLYEEIINNLGANMSFRLALEDELIAEDKNLLEGLNHDSTKDLPEGVCLVTGRKGPIVRLFTATPLPGTKSTAALVAMQTDSGYDSYGKSQVFNSPISVEAESAISSVLKKFLGKESVNKIRLGNRMFLFWGSGDKGISTDVERGLMSLFQFPDKKQEAFSMENIEKVSKLFKSIFSGEIKTTLEDSFHILGLAPNTGRIAVVMWMDTTLKDFASKILEHFEDMEIIDNRKPEKIKPYVGVYSIISVATMGGKISDALPRLVEETVKAVINGSAYPYPLYMSTLQRIRAELSERGVTVERAAFLKAYINRNEKYKNQNKPLTVMLDKENSNPGYLCGRLTAVLEKIQTDVNSGDSIRTRYMGAASSTPAAVLPAMLNLSLHHSEKLSEGSRIYYEQLKQEILDKISGAGFPATLDLADQGRFFVGYYHQRADLFTKKEK
ncbi:MAG: type I-C CRISPR-associated protein Cas8c/Csd1 [Muribaculaceae bacterium]|nr:type I-C CRISPR-associated protein Cas8c/Csd1 [Muribaculaceae bacterium]